MRSPCDDPERAPPELPDAGRCSKGADHAPDDASEAACGGGAAGGSNESAEIPNLTAGVRRVDWGSGDIGVGIPNLTDGVRRVEWGSGDSGPGANVGEALSSSLSSVERAADHAEREGGAGERATSESWTECWNRLERWADWDRGCETSVESLTAFRRGAPSGIAFASLANAARAFGRLAGEPVRACMEGIPSSLPLADA